jgi:hypothetical protein
MLPLGGLVHALHVASSFAFNSIFCGFYIVCKLQARIVGSMVKMLYFASNQPVS